MAEILRLSAGANVMPASVPAVMQKRKAPSREPEKSKIMAKIESRPAQEAKDKPAIKKIRLTLKRSPNTGFARAGAMSAIYRFLLICTAP
ncbi:hypothetical protein ACT3UA_00450 [Glutamicibacter sp. 363]|uniref:hypothetical protein n=1 Tax=unclassified Glutamicibacter TaxID=2627139 RepID=UPI001596DEE8|nr:hypothetical protein [Glutamicibacter sp. BW80]